MDDKIDKQQKKNKTKSTIKCIFKVLWIIVWLVWIWFVSAILCLLVWLNDPITNISVYLTMLLIILLIVIIILFCKTYSKKNIEHKNRLKKFLVILLPIYILLWWWLTWAWLLPNRFNIKFLYKDTDCSNHVCLSLAEIPIFVERVWCVCAWNINSWLLKPIIYLYPTKEKIVHVELWNPKNLSHTYPKYNLETWWNVIAKPNWDLIDVDTNRKLYALYREWKSNSETNFDEWFVVAWKDIIPFLEEKLAILGLNEREAEEFIVYWLPEMENNKWNLIRFKTIEEIDKDMPLDITPIPDTVIRIMMDWKAIDEPINISEQTLVTPERIWFTVVEWWGSPKN